MSEKILKALMQLFAIIGSSEKGGAHGRKTVAFFLQQQLNRELVDVYLKEYDQYFSSLNKKEEGEKLHKRTSVSSVKVIVICRQINEALTQKQKLIVLIRLIEFVKSNNRIGDLESEFIETVSSEFNIPVEEYNSILGFVTNDNPFQILNSEDLLVINSKADSLGSLNKHIFSEGLNGEIFILYVKSIGIYLMKHFSNSEIYLNGQLIGDKRIHILTQGSIIRSSKLLPIYYSDVVSKFLIDSKNQNFSFEVKHVEYVFKNGKKGLRDISFTESSGKMVGIMGGSGAGKSTLLNVLNGNEVPTSGEVLLNGLNLHSQSEQLEGIVGYVPQEDLLIEELTVYQNLFFNTKLCFADYSDEKINELVNNLLLNLGLYESKDLQVGSPLNKIISGGQRKRLNIALELIREPAVLFIDEPTSGLSSRDSENIMDLLKELTLTGKLVFVVIHQPSSDIFKMIDNLLILDFGGYPIYYGNPVESLTYFKSQMNFINASVAECEVCGNVNSEQVFNIIEAKVLDENGNPTHTRKVSPSEWNEIFNNKLLQGNNNEVTASGEIKSDFKKPGFFAQLKLFLNRDVLSKISNKQYLFINFLEAPFLAFILALLTKYYKNGNEYIFSENKNLIAYIFICVVVSLFIGLTVSAEEIIKDRKILKREKFLNLSKGSYLLSKILLLFTISAIQTLCFVLVGNLILGINGMFAEYWLVLFSTSCFANMLGLNISSAFDSSVTIYILIPFLIIPQILLSGLIVKFDELHPVLARKSVVPLTGDLMASRWAFEALAVNQYKNNAFQKQFYEFDKVKNEANFKRSFWYSEMMEACKTCDDKAVQPPVEENANTCNTFLLANEIGGELKKSPISFNMISELEKGKFNPEISAAIKLYLSKVKSYYANLYNTTDNDLNLMKVSFQKSEEGTAKFNRLKNENQNIELENLVNEDYLFAERTFIDNGRLYQNGASVLRDARPGSFIRAHLYAPQKYLFGRLVSTFWVNVAVIWGMTTFLAIMLYFDVLRKIIKIVSYK